MNTSFSSALPHGYRWKCIVDPTGVFKGRIFRAIDLETDCPDENGWTDGTTFQHIQNHRKKTVINGRLVTIQPQKMGH